MTRDLDRNAGPRTALNWRVRGILNLYRVLVPLVLVSLYSLGGGRGITVDSPRLFFLATAGLFGARKGEEWAVSHYLLKPVA